MTSHIAYRISHIAKAPCLCLCSAILLILSFPGFNIWLFAWFGFVPLFFALENKSKRRAFLLSYITGVIFWFGIIYWLAHVTLAGLIVLVLYLALYFAIFGVIISLVPRPSSLVHLLFVPSIWVILEYLRSYLFTGFGWALLGYSQYQNLPIIQMADLTGAWGVSFLVMMANVTIYLVAKSPSHQVSSQTRRYLGITLCIIIAALTYGYCEIYRTTQNAQRRRLKVSVIQGNIPQELKWAPNAKGYILDKYARLSEEAAYHGADLIVWPEASNPGLLGEDNLIFQDILNLSKKTEIPLVIGTVVYENEKYFNTALMIKPSGEIAGRYDKLHLVPFGEYIPLKKALPFLETVVPIGDITPGKEYTVFSHNAGRTTQDPIRFSVLICFEDLFPELSRQFVKRGANFLVNITNDAWYKKTAAGHQHLLASVFRAVENRVFLVRSANTGVSGFIAPNGKIISLVKDKTGREIFVDGYKTEAVTITKGHLTFYTRYGDVFIIFLFIFIIYSIFRLARLAR